MSHPENALSFQLKRIKVRSVTRSRYPVGTKPILWDDRVAGLDVVSDESGQDIVLKSEGDQSSPAPGWELLLTGKNGVGEYSWTLYGISKSK